MWKWEDVISVTSGKHVIESNQTFCNMSYSDESGKSRIVQDCVPNHTLGTKSYV